MEKPDASDASRFTDGHGADETFCRPFVELRACATGIKLMAVFWCTHPHRQIAFPVTGNFCGTGLCASVAIFKRHQTGLRLSDGIRKIVLLNVHNLLSSSFRREFTPARASAGVSQSPVVRGRQLARPNWKLSSQCVQSHP